MPRLSDIPLNSNTQTIEMKMKFKKPRLSFDILVFRDYTRTRLWKTSYTSNSSSAFSQKTYVFCGYIFFLSSFFTSERTERLERRSRHISVSVKQTNKQKRFTSSHLRQEDEARATCDTTAYVFLRLAKRELKTKSTNKCSVFFPFSQTGCDTHLVFLGGFFSLR